jgi:hypothetical protein
MNSNIKCIGLFIIILLLGLFSPLRVEGNTQNHEKAKYEKEISVVIRTLKDVFEPNEPVPLIVAIANHNSEPVYLDYAEEDIYTTFYKSFCDVSDVNNTRIRMSEPIPERFGFVFESDYLVFNGGKSLVVPVYKIDGHEVMIAIIADAIRLYHGNMPEGTYYIDPYIVTTFRDVNDTIVIRENFPHRLWADAKKTVVSRIYSKSNTVKIEIRSKLETQDKPESITVLESQTLTKQPTAIAETRTFPWYTFLVGAAAGFSAFSLILLLVKKSKKT